MRVFIAVDPTRIRARAQSYLWVMIACTALGAHTARAEPSGPADNWGGASDHAWISFGIGMGANVIRLRPAAGMAVCMTPGLIREIHDYYKPSPGTRHGLFSRRDLLSDAVGCGLGYLSADGVRWAITGRSLTFSARF